MYLRLGDPSWFEKANIRLCAARPCWHAPGCDYSSRCIARAARDYPPYAAPVSPSTSRSAVLSLTSGKSATGCSSSASWRRVAERHVGMFLLHRRNFTVTRTVQADLRSVPVIRCCSVTYWRRFDRRTPNANLRGCPRCAAQVGRRLQNPVSHPPPNQSYNVPPACRK
jgi:hypothetical protein